MTKIAFSNTLTAFNDSTIGSKVTHQQEFLRLVEFAIFTHDFGTDRIPGQAYLSIPEAIPYVSSGQGENTFEPRDYVLREHRGRVHAYLKRYRANPVVEVAVVIYTKEAYLNDPDISESGQDEFDRITNENPDYVLVAVIASPVKHSALSPYRFVKNLAGGNREALSWSADEIRSKAREIAEQTDRWCIVAD
jgi:hypothetical protein